MQAVYRQTVLDTVIAVFVIGVIPVFIVKINYRKHVRPIGGDIRFVVHAIVMLRKDMMAIVTKQQENVHVS